MASDRADMQGFNQRDDARTYIQELFRFVLHRSNPKDDDVEYWTTFLIECQDPVDVFRRFANSTENRDRLSDPTLSDPEPFPNGHFYSPINDRRSLVAARERLFSERSLPDLDLNVPGQVSTFETLKPFFITMPFSDDPGGSYRYHYDNSSYGFGDAAVYWAMIGAFKPDRIIEVGSGFTSALALDAIDYFQLPTSCTFIEPYPALLNKLAASLQERHQVIQAKVETLDPEFVSVLQPNDFLFIDSSHVVKTGSDVHYEITQLLPRLSPGVIVHFHDIFYPFEYPERWVLNEKKSWNELYFIHAFLLFNNAFEILYFNDYVCRRQSDLHRSLPDSIRDRIKLNPGGGLWLRRR